MRCPSLICRLTRPACLQRSALHSRCATTDPAPCRAQCDMRPLTERPRHETTEGEGEGSGEGCGLPKWCTESIHKSLSRGEAQNGCSESLSSQSHGSAGMAARAAGTLIRKLQYTRLQLLLVRQQRQPYGVIIPSCWRPQSWRASPRCARSSAAQGRSAQHSSGELWWWPRRRRWHPMQRAPSATGKLPPCRWPSRSTGSSGAAPSKKACQLAHL